MPVLGHSIGYVMTFLPSVGVIPAGEGVDSGLFSVVEDILQYVCSTSIVLYPSTGSSLRVKSGCGSSIEINCCVVSIEINCCVVDVLVLVLLASFILFKALELNLCLRVGLAPCPLPLSFRSIIVDPAIGLNMDLQFVIDKLVNYESLLLS